MLQLKLYAVCNHLFKIQISIRPIIDALISVSALYPTQQRYTLYHLYECSSLPTIQAQPQYQQAQTQTADPSLSIRPKPPSSLFAHLPPTSHNTPPSPRPLTHPPP